MSYTEAQMILIDGKAWTKNDGTRRVYLNNWHQLVGIEITYYKSGNISYAEHDGVQISNGKATKLINAKVYWEAGRLHTESVDESVRARLERAVSTAVETAEMIREGAETIQS